jgi:hypothetical protein
VDPGRRKNHKRAPVAAEALLLILFSAALTSCAVYRVATVPSLAETSDGSGPRVAGYTTIDGRRHSFDGYLRSTGDWITFVAPPHRSSGLSAVDPERVVTLPRDQVASVTLQDGTDIPRSILAGTAFLVFFGLMAALVHEGGLWPRQP